jgi:predicted Fe-S protein YdhL (DUF1289 family)
MIAFPAAMFMFANPVAALESMTVVATPPAIESPCNRICSVDPTSGLCIGCGRNLAEITHWIGLSHGERSRIMAELPQRLASLRATNTNPVKQA